MAAAIFWLYTNRKAILITFSVILFFILWFTIERQSDRIVSQKAEIKALTAEVESLRTEYAQFQADVKTVRLYLNKIETITQKEREQMDENEKVCKNVSDFNSIVPRLNELFGQCANKTRSAD